MRHDNFMKKMRKCLYISIEYTRKIHSWVFHHLEMFDVTKDILFYILYPKTIFDLTHG